jgi:hypothetical protein
MPGAIVVPHANRHLFCDVQLLVRKSVRNAQDMSVQDDYISCRNPAPEEFSVIAENPAAQTPQLNRECLPFCARSNGCRWTSHKKSYYPAMIYAHRSRASIEELCAEETPNVL